MQDLPTGTITLLFTDIEGSTRLWEERPDEMAGALAIHDSIVREEIEASRGVVFKTVGDAFHAAFAGSSDAVAAALAIQARLLQADLPFLVRVALHSGEPQLREHDYFGPAVNRAARILSAAHGGQIIISAITRRLSRPTLPPEARLIDLGFHRLKDLAEPEELFQLTAEGLASSFPPLLSLSTHRHNLPAQLTSFVGRETELEELCGLLDSDARLVTLTGVGGTGKTRLAAQAAAERIERYPGGVWWIDLSTLRDPAGVLSQIGVTLGLDESDSSDLNSRIADRLGASRALLVLDNFEQVLDAATGVTGLLRAVPSLQVLATSRAALNVSGEHDYALGEMGMDESMALFAARAQQVQSRFTPDGENRAAVESICRRLEGIPLAIELAAAQARVLSVAQIGKQLDQRFRTLVSPYRDVSQRQRTLRSTVDWSYDLLEAGERELFALLSVFTGGFTFEAAEAVSARNDVFHGIARLREQSMLRLDESMDVPRFRMLETLREYGQEKLAEGGELEGARQRHAAYFRDLVLSEDDRMAAGIDESASPLIAQDYDNVRAALGWMIETRRGAEAARTACGLGRFWEGRGRFRDARQALAETIRVMEGTSDAVLRARLLGWAGWFADLQNDHDEADRLQQGSLALCRAAGDRAGEGRALNHLALTARNQKRFGEARPLFVRSLEIARELADEPAQASRLNNLALLAIEEKRWDEAAGCLREALAIYQSNCNQRGIAACHCNLGELAVNNERWEEARAHLEEGLALFTRIEEKRGVASCLDNLVRVNLATGRAADAFARAREALAICVDVGMRQLALDVLDKVVGARTDPAASEFARSASRAAAILHQASGALGGGERAAVAIGDSLPPLAAVADGRPWEDVVRSVLNNVPSSL